MGDMAFNLNFFQCFRTFDSERIPFFFFFFIYIRYYPKLTYLAFIKKQITAVLSSQAGLILESKGKDLIFQKKGKEVLKEGKI